MADREIKTFLVGDSTSLQKAMDKAGAGAKDMAGDLDKAAGDAKKFGSAIDTAADRTDRSERSFMGTADVLDGLGTAFGLPLSGATELSRAAGDLTGGFTNLAPAIKGFGGTLSAVATGPMGVWLIVGAAIAAALVLLWKNSETFRDIVTGAFEAVKNVIEPVADAIGGAIGWVSDKLGIGGDDAEAWKERQKAALEDSFEAYQDWKGNLEGVLDSMIDPFERFNHNQTLSLEEATANLAVNKQEYEKWLTDLTMIAQRYGTDVAQYVADQGPKFHGVADQLANATGSMGRDFAQQVTDIQAVRREADALALSLAGLGVVNQVRNLNTGGGLLSSVLPWSRRHSGGTVPGPMGRETPIIAQGGERVTPLGQGAGGQPLVVRVEIDGQVVGEVAHNELLAIQRRSGNLGFEAA